MAGRRVPQPPIKLQILADEIVKGHGLEIAKSQAPSQAKYLSALDQTYLGYSCFGGQVLFRTSVVAPLLKQAFAQVLTEQPWFAGRLEKREDGHGYDVACNNAGGRIIFASTSATLAQLEEALAPSAPSILGPTTQYALPHNVDQIVKRKLPLCLVYLLHLSGGGALLVIRISHCLVDFTGLQTFVDHLATAYNTALALEARRAGGAQQSSSETPGGTGAVGSEAAAAAPLLPPPRRQARPAFFAPEAFDAIAESLTLPPGAKERERVVAVPAWKGPFVFLHILYSILFRGGGVQARYMLLSAERLAELKRQATEELIRAATASALPPGPPAQHGHGGVAPSGAAGGGGGAGAGGSQRSSANGSTAGSSTYGDGSSWPSLSMSSSSTSTSSTGSLSGADMGIGGSDCPADDGSGKGYNIGKKTVEAATAASVSAAAATATDAAAGIVSASEKADALLRSGWVSTRDCLAARLAQLLHSAPLKNHPAWQFFIVANLRPRAVPRLPDGQLGNWVWGARVDEVAPCRMGLGELAARVRAALDRLPPEISDHLRHVRDMASSHPAQQLMVSFMLESDPRKCLFSPEGPVMINAWQLRHEVWQFGPEPPLAFAPAVPPGLMPNIVLSYPAPPGPDGTDRGLVLHVSLHRSLWRQLDAATGGDLLAAL